MTEKQEKSGPSKVKTDTLHPSLQDLKLGVWRIVWEPGPPLKFHLPWTTFSRSINTFRSELHTLLPFFKEVYRTLGPLLLATYMVSDLWSGFGSTALLVFSNRVLTAVGVFDTR